MKINMEEIKVLAIEYAQLKHKEEYNDPSFAPDVENTINDFIAGFEKAIESQNIEPSDILNMLRDERNVCKICGGTGSRFIPFFSGGGKLTPCICIQ